MKTRILTMALLAVSLPASAEWVAGGGYLSLSDDDDSFRLGGVYGSVGYQFKGNSNWSFLPELRLGLGLGDDSLLGVDIELDSYLSLSARGQYDFESGWYLYAQPSYSRAEFTASAQGISVSTDDWDFGLGGGAGYKFTDKVWGEASYEVIDGGSILNFGLKYTF